MKPTSIKKHPSLRGGNGTYLPREVINSPAFRDLNGTEILIYLDFRLRFNIRKNGRVKTILNNGELVYTYAEAKRWGISSPSFQRAIDGLIDHGFLYVAETGAGLYKSATLYGVRAEWENWGTPQFKPMPRERTKSRRPNVGFKKGHPYHPPKNKR
jgi:hypothetical protein